MLDNPLQHDWIEVRPMIPAIAAGQMYDLRVGFFCAVRAAIDMEAGRVEMGKARSQSEALGSRRRNETVELRHARGIEGIQGPTEGIIIEL
jgi:hypothetical protein